MTATFEAWPKIGRAKGSPLTVTVTEKIDGTNACIIIENGEITGIQSRTRLITPESDNFGFARWVMDNAGELVTWLGDGRHFGEWAGPGIQKNPHNLLRKTLFLFNTQRWNHAGLGGLGHLGVTTPKVLYIGPYGENLVRDLMETLKLDAEDQGYEPEGIVIFWHWSRTMQKMTFKNPEGKWAEAA
jgi:hypothetical protein